MENVQFEMRLKCISTQKQNGVISQAILKTAVENINVLCGGDRYLFNTCLDTCLINVKQHCVCVCVRASLRARAISIAMCVYCCSLFLLSH